MNWDFQDKVVLVTGSATGIGKAAARAFAESGAQVILATGHRFEKGETAAAEIRAEGGKALFLPCDVTEETQVGHLIAEIVSRFGQLDIAFNNAGVGPDGVRMQFHELTDLPVEDWDKTMAVNARGVFLCLKYELRQMKLQKSGAIVNTSSIGGLKMWPTYGAYGPSKAAVIAVTKTAASEAAPYGIRVNAVCPGPTLGTDLMDNAMATGTRAAKGSGNGISIPLGKFGETSDVVNTVLWLCSDCAGHVTAHAVPVDGGKVEIG